MMEGLKTYRPDPSLYEQWRSRCKTPFEHAILEMRQTEGMLALIKPKLEQLGDSFERNGLDKLYNALRKIRPEYIGDHNEVIEIALDKIPKGHASQETINHMKKDTEAFNRDLLEAYRAIMQWVSDSLPAAFKALNDEERKSLKAAPDEEKKYDWMESARIHTNLALQWLDQTLQEKAAAMAQEPAL